jgi:hypothetical protein
VIEGFDPILDISTFHLAGIPFSEYSADFRFAVSNAILNRTTGGPSTLSMQIIDPNRDLLQTTYKGNYLLQPGLELTIKGQVDNGVQVSEDLLFSCVQVSKAGSMVQLTFESQAVYDLRNMRGRIGSYGDLNSFFKFLIDECNASKGTNYKLVASDVSYVNLIYSNLDASIAQTATPQPMIATRGSDSDPYEDSWTAMMRMASSLGYRCWENSGTIFLGPDEYWIGLASDGVTHVGTPPVNALYNHDIPSWYEFTEGIQVIDYDWDIGKPFGNATITCMLDFFSNYPGEVVTLSDIGPGTGHWIINNIQRDLFNSIGSISCQIPIPSNALINTTSLPQAGRTLVG